MPAAPRQRKKNATKVSLITSLVFHGAIVGALVFFAAREGFLGKQLKTIAVTMAPKEKPPEPEKPKEPEKLPEPPPEQPKVVEPQPQVAQAPPPTAPAAQLSNLAPPPAAPPPAGLPSFNFSDGAKAVESSSDPVQLYKGFVEFTIRSKWLRPEGLADEKFVAEVELRVDPAGQILGYDWKRGSGHAAWDESVRKAVAGTRSIGRVPPKGFPGTFLVRFDVVGEVAADSLALP
jgi:hypothetical protein